MSVRHSIFPLLVSTAVVGLLGGCMIISHLERPINPSQLRVFQGGSKAAPTSSHAFLASRAAIQATESPYTVHGILRRLLTPPKNGAYVFRREYLVKNNARPRSSLFSGKTLDEEAAPAEGDSAPAPAPPADDDSSSRINPDGEGDEEPDVWSPYDDADELTRTELEDIVTTSLPALVFFCILLAIVEITAMFARRGRDWMLQTGQWKANEAAFRAQVGKESQHSTFRPWLSGLFIFCIFSSIVSAIDLYGKCYWNWACFFDLDCNLSILTPAVAECAGDVLFPSFILAALIVTLIISAIWCFTRAYAAAFIFAIFLTGVLSISSSSPFMVLLWCLSAVGAAWFYFGVLPFFPEDVPFWCEDLGSLSASSDPLTKEILDGELRQRWRTVELSPQGPTMEEASHFQLVERFTWGLADFMARHCKAWRMFWNGVVIRCFVWLVVGRRVRIHGQEHVAHLASHDCVLLAANHRTFFDFFVISACGIWPYSGASLFSIYPVRATFFYSDLRGALLNLLFSACAMFPPIFNTPSDEARGEGRKGGKEWNEYAMRRLGAELQVPGTVVGFHPEGTRNQGKNPCAMSRTKNGVGRLALEATHSHIIPVFVMGLGEDLWTELKWNYSEPEAHPIDIVFGPHVDLSALREEAAAASDRRELYAAAGRRVAQGIKVLAKEHAERLGVPYEEDTDASPAAAAAPAAGTKAGQAKEGKEEQLYQGAGAV